MQYFDVEAKIWKPLASLAPATELMNCYCTETVGSKLYVAGVVSFKHSIYCYDIERDVWEELPHSGGVINNLCIIGDYMYPIRSDNNYYSNEFPQRYSFSECQWQGFERASLTGSHVKSNGATVLHSKVFVLYGQGILRSHEVMYNALLYCFDPVRNVWEQKASTCKPHFGSCLFEVNSKLYVAGGNVYIDGTRLCGNPAPVEVYDEENNKWSVVDQKHIPPNNLGAVEIEGRVYFIINKFPVDSGIRIPPGDVYPVSLETWVNLRSISDKAAICYVAVKRESLKAE